MKICKIWDADYPWDIRVEKVILSLIEAGHSVDLVCRNQARQSRVETNGKFTIRRLPALPRILGPLHTLCNFPLPLNPVWVLAIVNAIRAGHADLILIRDLPLALPAAILGKIHRIPVVFDMAEHYPAMLEDRLNYTPTGMLGRLVRYPGMARFIERATLRFVDHTLVVVEESRNRLVDAGYPFEKVTVVSNTPRIDQWESRDMARGQGATDGIVNLFYLGNLDGIRGLDVSIRALRILKDQGHRTHLTVIGDGPSLTSLRQLADELGVSDRAEFVGRLSLHDEAAMIQIKEIMGRSHIGLIPHYVTEACNTTVPNKLFDYMVMGLPVIVSDMKPTARIVDQEQCGEVFKDRDPVDLARCVRKLESPDVRREKGARGQSAIKRRYNWGVDAKVMVKTLEDVSARHLHVS